MVLSRRRPTRSNNARGRGRRVIQITATASNGATIVCHAERGRWQPLKLAQHGLDQSKGLIQLRASLRPSEHNFAAVEDKHHEFRLGQPVDQPREQFGVIPTELVVFIRQAFEPDRELQIARGNHVLDGEVRQLNGEA